MTDTQPEPEPTIQQQRAEVASRLRHDPGVAHIYLNAFACVNPTDEFAASLGRDIIRKVMSNTSEDMDVFDRRHIVLRINAS